jgi:DNA-binding response OmpR family regulator
MFKIMVIEDDKKLSSLIVDSLNKYGYNTYRVQDFNNIGSSFDEEKPQLVLLDINLPYYDGFYFCRLFRKKSKIPIIIMSARSGDVEQIMGIELGADDYVVKPFNINVLIAKIKAALRRTYGEFSETEQNNKVNFEENFPINLDAKSFKVTFNQKVAELSKNEFKLMKKLLDNKNTVISREELLSELWDDSSFVDDNTLTVNITRVKNKLSELGIDNVIKTKRGAGYIFDTSSLEGVFKNE